MNYANVMIAKKRLICSVLLLASLTLTCEAQKTSEASQHLAVTQKSTQKKSKKSRLILPSLLIASAAVDTGTTLHNLSVRKYSCLGLNGTTTCGDWRDTVKMCHEQNPVFGRHPSAGRVIGTEVAITTGEILLAHLLRSKGHNKLAVFILGESIIEHGTASGLNMQQPCF